MFEPKPDTSAKLSVHAAEALLQGAQEKLDVAAHILATTGLLGVSVGPGRAPNQNVCGRLLQEAAGLLTEVQQTYASRPTAVLAALTRGVQERTLRIQLLLDAAAGFYCGWLSAAPLPSADYSRPGNWLNASSAARWMMEA